MIVHLTLTFNNSGGMVATLIAFYDVVVVAQLRNENNGVIGIK